MFSGALQNGSSLAFYLDNPLVNVSEVIGSYRANLLAGVIGKLYLQ
jgi:hypothetical protein